MLIHQALATAASLGLARLDAQLLLLHALHRHASDRAWLIAHDDDALDPAAAGRFTALAHRRAAGEPVAYLLGHKEFHGLDLKVDARVLVPRPDTEVLVDWALELLPRPPATPRVLDLGTGSGAIALAVKHRAPQADVEAVDASEAALCVAAANAEALRLDVRFRRASWLDGAGRYELIVSNPPYVRDDDPHLDDLAHEPRSALAAGPDGLDDLRRIAAAAREHLEPGGWLLLEHGWDQAAAVRGLLAAAGFAGIATRKDLAGIERCTGGRAP
ncbi:peptide chain release factor N(5)-glutamine methyltransferase [Ramlibacter sp.]|uniref:peptide chain release factor N(5)-glutamine methyltransferase n=1 Tax=Ramlibacter sp. TaxID=1917967 RepID=UPI003D1009C0